MEQIALIPAGTGLRDTMHKMHEARQSEVAPDAC